MKFKKLGLCALILGLCGCSTFGKSPYDIIKGHKLKYRRLSESGEFEVSGRLYNNQFRHIKYTLSNLDKDPKLDLELWVSSRDYYIKLHIGDGEGSGNLIDGNINYVEGDLSLYEGDTKGHFKTYVKYNDEGKIEEVYPKRRKIDQNMRDEGNSYLKYWQEKIEKEFGEKVKIPGGVK